MYLKSLELSGFKSFARKSTLEFSSPISAIVGPNGSGKSNIAEALRFVLGEQSFKSMRGRRGEDLIFGGTQGAPRANRAAVKITFDNSSRFLDLEYEEVEIERVVHRDGVNQYSINGSQVRLKDIAELLACANIGPSGYHIISQGEADRILSASSRDRREVIEDALGLKVYQFKKKESERKLSRTDENIKHVESLRKEVQPHLRFLERQVKKVERTLAMKEELKERYCEYLKREEMYLAINEKKVESARQEPQRESQQLAVQLKEAEKRLAESEQHDEKSEQVLSLEKELSELRLRKDTLHRDIGRLEGQIAAEERRLEQEKRRQASLEERTVRVSEVRTLTDEIEQAAGRAMASKDIGALRAALETIRENIKRFLASVGNDDTGKMELDTASLEEHLAQKKRLDGEMETVAKREQGLNEAYQKLQREIEAGKDTSREAEREIFRITTRQGELRTALAELEHQASTLARDRSAFEQEIQEGIVLVGQAVARYKDHEIANVSGNDVAEEAREKQEQRKRDIERIKIRIEEAGGGSGDEIMREYQEVQERDAFLGRELADLAQSAEQLKQLIRELEEKLDAQFKEGLDKINREFQNFFSLLFGGGTANLVAVKEKIKRRGADLEGIEEVMPDEEEEDGMEGIEINVSLPRKRIKGLDMLSGGERALTSIALLFAMSQVNPPPFIVLDETDAALDEANSKKYADMTEKLSKKSQLVLITHNRETMSRAGILYGITMGSDGVSKLLSVKFEEAVAVAK